MRTFFIILAVVGLGYAWNDYSELKHKIKDLDSYVDQLNHMESQRYKQLSELEAKEDADWKLIDPLFQQYLISKCLPQSDKK